MYLPVLHLVSRFFLGRLGVMRFLSRRVCSICSGLFGCVLSAKLARVSFCRRSQAVPGHAVIMTGFWFILRCGRSATSGLQRAGDAHMACLRERAD